MTLKKILIVSGTHGNEINPVWAVNQFCKQDQATDNNNQVGIPTSVQGWWLTEV